MLRINKEAALSTKLLEKLIQTKRTAENPRLQRLNDYYEGKSNIIYRQMADATKPNNKIVNPFANYISDCLTGYFMGEPVTYKSQDEKALEELQMIFNYNDEQDENAELAKDASIYGVAYEMLYVDMEGQVRFKEVNPLEVIFIYDNTVEEELLYAIRFYLDTDIMTDKSSTMVEVYTKDNITYYKGSESASDLQFIEEKTHFFSLVPFVQYVNNEAELGDFELVISEIDAYDKLMSDSLNDFEYFCDAYLGLYGMTADADDIQMMKENRVILMDEGAKAEWIIKNVNDAQMENLKVRLEEDIHKYSKCPNLNDENFAGNASGVAMAYKVMGTENLTSIKERKFKKGLQRRLELIASIQGLKGFSFDWRGIEIVFTRNLPQDRAELVDMAVKLNGIVSQETVLSQLPFIEDVAAEVQRLEQEREKSNLFYSELGELQPAEEE